MLPPHEIKSKGFTHVLRGYSAPEVDEYADFVLREYTELYRENDALETRIKELEAQLDKFRQDEESIRDALVDANRRSTEIVDEANERAKIILHSAKLNCDRILSEFRSAVKEERDELLLLRGMVKKFKDELFLAYQTHIEYIEKIAPELDNLDESEFSDEAVIRLAVESIKGDILEGGEDMSISTVTAEDLDAEAEDTSDKAVITEVADVSENETEAEYEDTQHTDGYDETEYIEESDSYDEETEETNASSDERNSELEKVVSSIDLSGMDDVGLRTSDEYELVVLDATESLAEADEMLRGEDGLDIERLPIESEESVASGDDGLDEFLFAADPDSDLFPKNGRTEETYEAFPQDDDESDYLDLLNDITGG